jgi:hypothetical protein
MLEYLDLKNVGPAPEMRMDLAPRLNLITGDNGLGKSFLLDVAWWALTRRWPAEVNPGVSSGLIARPQKSGPASIGFSFSGKVRQAEYVSTYDRREEAWTGRPGRPANPGLVLYALVDGGFAVWDPARNYWKKSGGTDTQERRPAYVFSPREVWEGLRQDGIQLSNGILADWALWQKENGTAFVQLKDVLGALSPSVEDQLLPGDLAKWSVEDARWVPTLRMPYGIDVPVLVASAAMRRVVALAYLLVWSWQEHVRAAHLLDEPATEQVTVLIDEIESHLHPRWQRTIVRSLLAVMRALAGTSRVQVIAATHSPLLLASVEPAFDPKQDAWFDLDLEPQPPGPAAVRLRRREFVRRGEVSNWLTSEAFDLKSPRSVEAEAAIEQARALLRRGGEPTTEEVRLADEALRAAALPDIDPFWVRWTAYAEERGVRR